MNHSIDDELQRLSYDDVRDELRKLFDRWDYKRTRLSRIEVREIVQRGREWVSKAEHFVGMGNPIAAVYCTSKAWKLHAKLMQSVLVKFAAPAIARVREMRKRQTKSDKLKAKVRKSVAKLKRSNEYINKYIQLTKPAGQSVYHKAGAECGTSFSNVCRIMGH